MTNRLRLTADQGAKRIRVLVTSVGKTADTRSRVEAALRLTPPPTVTRRSRRQLSNLQPAHTPNTERSTSK